MRYDSDSQDLSFERKSSFAFSPSHSLQSPMDSDHELRWKWIGKRKSHLGSRWIASTYLVSNLEDFQSSPSDLVSTLDSILHHFQNQNQVPGDARLMLGFSGSDMNPETQRTCFAYSNRSNYTMRKLLNDPTPILHDIAQRLQSNEEFALQRVTINCANPGLAQGSGLADLPPEMRQLRDKIKGKKGYFTIEDVDKGCALDACIISLHHLLRSLTRKEKGNADGLDQTLKTLAKKKIGSKIQAKVRVELAKNIGWKFGTEITHKEIFTMIEAFSSAHNFRLGVIIFLAHMTAKDIVRSWQKNEPPHKIHLVHWYTPDIGGHYDALSSQQVTSFMKDFKSTANHNQVFSYNTLSLQRSDESDRHGLHCCDCGHSTQEWDRNPDWNSSHNLQAASRKDFKLQCPECLGKFRSSECLANHKVSPKEGKESKCELKAYCKKCKRFTDRGHKCGEWLCGLCHQKTTQSKAKHVCYRPPLSANKMRVVKDVVYSDLETETKKGWHEPVCVATYYFRRCSKHKKCKADVAFDSCVDCQRCVDCGPEERYDEGEDCLLRYLLWLTEEHKGGTVLFHNGGKFDYQILYYNILWKYTTIFEIVNDISNGTQFKCLDVKRRNTQKNTQVRLMDSMSHIQAPLRSFPDMFFGAKDRKNCTDKGHFPYDVLMEENWADRKTCPGYSYFSITDLEWNNRDKLNPKRRQYIQEVEAYIKEWEGKTWTGRQLLKRYALDDVKVLYEGCEVYRRLFHQQAKVDPFQFVTVPSAVIGALGHPVFTKPETFRRYRVQDQVWQRLAGYGGRTEVFKNYCRVDDPSQEEIRFVDFNSQYPSTQAFGYFPCGNHDCDISEKDWVPYARFAKKFRTQTGKRLYDVLHDPSGSSGVGLIEMHAESTDNFIPILPTRAKPPNGKTLKTLFMNKSELKGVWFITEVAQAVKFRQIIIKNIKRIQYWKGSNEVFRKFITLMYALKVKASGWSKLLGKDESEITLTEKKEFVEGCLRLGIPVASDTIQTNPALCSVIKIILNSLWGGLAQRPTGDETYRFDNNNEQEWKAMFDLYSKMDTEQFGNYRLKRQRGLGSITEVKVTKKHEDMKDSELNPKVAYQIGYQVPTYGRQKLNECLLALHPDQPIYCDTDSIIYKVNKKLLASGVHKDLKTGPFLGDLTNEYPTKRILEIVIAAPKSYAMLLEDVKTGKKEVKVKFKGIPLCSATYSLLDAEGQLAKLGLDEMKQLVASGVWSKGENSPREFELKYWNAFKRNVSKGRVEKKEEKKTARFTFDKRRILNPPVGTQNLNDVCQIHTDAWSDGVSLTKEDVDRFWSSQSLLD